jgi:transposase
VRTGCVGLVLQALDGTKIAAAASSHTGWTQEHMEKLLAALDESLAATELTLREENAEAPGYRLPAGLTARQALREKIQTGLAQLQADGRGHYHPAEPDARRMKTREGNRYAYNAQALTDAKHGIITAAAVTRQETDTGQLAPLLAQAQATIGPAATAPETLADGGYGAGADLQAAAAQGAKLLVPPAAGAPAQDKPYASQHFHYDESTQRVTCPQQRQLHHEGGTTRDGRRVERYRCAHHDCPVRTACSPDPKGRQIEIHAHTPLVQALRQRLATPEGARRYARRAAIAEPTFARIKQHDGFRRFTVWGLEAVHTQWAMICAAANLRVLYARWRERGGPAPAEPTGAAAAAA